MTKSSGSNTVSGAERKVVFRSEKRFELKAAEDFRVLRRPADAGGEVLLLHRIGNDDEMTRDAGSIFFGGAENEIGGGILKIAKRRAVNRVDDDGNTGASGGEPAENARLAAVGVDDVRFLFAQDFFKLSQREPVFERMNRPDEFGNDGKD